MLDASRAVRRRVEPAERARSARSFERRQRASCRSSCASSTARDASARCCRTRRRSRTGCRSTGRTRRCRRRRSSAAATIEVPLAELVPFIDWTFFFTAWELKGRFPAILDHPQYGAAARELYDNARDAARPHHRARSCSSRAASTASGRPRPTATTSCCSRDEHGAARSLRFNMLRQQEAIADGKPNLSLADFVADRQRAGARLHRRVRGHRRSRCRRTGARVRTGATTTTTRLWSRRWPIGWPRRSPRTCTRGRARLGHRPRTRHARRHHRREVPRHPPGLRLSRLSGSQREVQAVRPARRAARSASTLTEHAAMLPAASVSGLYFAHPQARYFTVGRVGRGSDRQLRAAQRELDRRHGTVAHLLAGI